MALMAVEYSHHHIVFTPTHLITLEMALMAVKWSGFYLKHVPAHLQTKEVIEAALKADPGAKQFIKVKEMFKNALEEALGE